ncbi:piggyBac transposable element-derived protein 4-like [Dermacentor silvarum]|uniref:piggyBac transposable element-derived protein 4-like n=1 Tax=Dermacentor silvarum TaxID=543639 RepID=UPI002100C06C|nr:piggyBac transposable element-derived protein 4-like [Dermacentor silvarum]
MPGERSLTAEEALEMFFSLPDGSESDVSSDSGDEFTVPSTSALAPIESSENDENIEPPPKKRPKKAYARKKKPKKARAKPIDHDSDHEEEEDDSLSAGWIAGQPCDIPVSITENPPTYSQKLNVDCSACDAFSLYFDEEVWKMIVEETNLYALQRMMPNWRTLTVSELKAYIGMLILMSIHNLPQVYLYWSSDKFFNLQEISNVMSFRRFQQITRCLHLNDNSKIPDKTSPNFDRCYRVRPLMEMLNINFQKEYKPSSYVAVDESMILFKGRSAMKQYMPLKPKIKRGYKVWSIADSQTGYLCKFDLYQGRTERRPTDMGLGFDVGAEASRRPGTEDFVRHREAHTAPQQAHHEADMALPPLPDGATTLDPPPPDG